MGHFSLSFSLSGLDTEPGLCDITRMATVSDNEIIRLRREAGRFRSLHERAKKRLAEQQAKHRETVAKLKVEHTAREEALKREVLELKLRVKKLQDLHFGTSSEKSRSFSGDLGAGGPKRRKKRPRGQQPGSKGHGRRGHPELPCEEHVCELAGEEAKCPVCGLAYEVTGLENTSEQIEFEVRLYRRRTRRPQYRPACSCQHRPTLTSALIPARAFPRSVFSDSFWIEVLLLKYEYQLPLNRIAALLAGHGLHGTATGTLCGGIGRATDTLRPLFSAVVERDKAVLLRHMDETGLAVFVEGRRRTARKTSPRLRPHCRRRSQASPTRRGRNLIGRTTGRLSIGARSWKACSATGTVLQCSCAILPSPWTITPQSACSDRWPTSARPATACTLNGSDRSPLCCCPYSPLSG